MTRAARWGAIAVAAAIALTGCVRVTADTSLHSDDTFSQSVVVAYTESARSQAEQMLGQDLGEIRTQLEDSQGFKELAAEYPDQVLIGDYADGDLTGVELTLEDIPLDEYRAAADDFTGALPVAAGATIEREGDTFVVTLEAGGGSDALAEAGVSPAQLALIEGSVDVGMTFTFPGLVQSATAGEVEGKTVTLGLADLAAGGQIRIVGGAESAIDWKPILTWAGIILAFVVVVGGAAALVVQDRRRRRHTALPAPGTQGESTIGTLPASGAPEEPAGPDEESPTTR